MNEQTVMELGRNTLMVAVTVVGPLLLVSMTVGLLMSVVQTITSLQEQTLTMVPKLAAVALALLILMPRLLQTLVAFAAELLGNLDRFAT